LSERVARFGEAAAGDSVKAFSADSSCMIAGVCPWHEYHGPAAASLERRFIRGLSLVVAGHALLEAYAVMTRLPTPYRLSGPDAWHLLGRNFADRATVLGCDGGAYVPLLDRLAASGVTGGRSYDALIATVLAPVGGVEFLTLNPRHFDRLHAKLVIVDPRQEAS
jgi:hypothetical protein